MATVFRDLDIPFSEQAGRVMRASRRSAVLLFLAMLATSTAGALSEDAYSTTVTIHDHRFEPAEIHVPAGKRIVLTVINTDPLSEEFELSSSKGRKGNIWQISGPGALRSTRSWPLRVCWRISRRHRKGTNGCTIVRDGASTAGSSVGECHPGIVAISGMLTSA